ncbi:MAG: hypothetical protein ACO3HP_04605 [Candidatus Nanopelagicaceae bacterium]
MAQMMLNGEQHDAVLIRGDENGGPIPVSIASGVTLNGVSIGAEIEIANDAGNPVPVVQGFNIPPYDYIDLAYSGTTVTGVTYKTGGSGGTTVATLALTYSGTTLISIAKS